jgi:hypothetical protein
MLLQFTRYFYFILISNLHPFHVSICEVYYNPKTQSLEISMKIFIDDLELAIQNQGNTEFKLINSNDNNFNKTPLKSYITDRFMIKTNSKTIDLDLVGYEFENDAILCYFEGKKIKDINVIEIENSIISEVFDDQINLTHFQYNGEMKSIKATKGSTTGIINTSGW